MGRSEGTKVVYKKIKYTFYAQYTSFHEHCCFLDNEIKLGIHELKMTERPVIVSLCVQSLNCYILSLSCSEKPATGSKRILSLPYFFNNFIILPSTPISSQ